MSGQDEIINIIKAGIEDETLNHADGCIEIPQYGTKHSINVSVAVGIVIWDVLGKMKLF